MLVRNGRNAFAFLASNKNRGIKALDGSSANASITNVLSYFSNATIVVGTGTTPASVDDYDLANQLTDGITISVVSKTNTSVDRAYSSDEPLMFVNCLITNETENDISITEIGITIAQSSSTSLTYLLTRTVLTQPLVLEAGKTYQLRVDIN